MKIRYEETNDILALTTLFDKNEMDTAEGEFTDGITSLTKGFVAFDEEAGNKLVGGVALARRMGKDIINGIAVMPEYRRKGIAEDLLKLAMAEALFEGVQTVWIVARAPLFFQAQGFQYITEKEVAPGLFDCLTCSQYNKVCFPKLMKYTF